MIISIANVPRIWFLTSGSDIYDWDIQQYDGTQRCIWIFRIVLVDCCAIPLISKEYKYLYLMIIWIANVPKVWFFTSGNDIYDWDIQHYDGTQRCVWKFRIVLVNCCAIPFISIVSKYLYWLYESQMCQKYGFSLHDDDMYNLVIQEYHWAQSICIITIWD